LSEGVDVRLKEILRQIAIDIQVDILELEIMPDHVHLLIEAEPQFGVHKAVKRFKGASSRYLRQEFPHLKKKLPTLSTTPTKPKALVGA